RRGPRGEPDHRPRGDRPLGPRRAGPDALDPLTRVRIILDTDTGVDDALAIALALRSPELEVVALTAVSGDGPGGLCAENAQRVRDVVEDATPAGLRRPLVFKGEAAPLARPLLTAPEVHGADGLGGVTLLRHPEGGLKYPPPRGEPAPEAAPRAILDLIAQ